MCSTELWEEVTLNGVQKGSILGPIWDHFGVGILDFLIRGPKIDHLGSYFGALFQVRDNLQHIYSLRITTFPLSPCMALKATRGVSRVRSGW